MAGISQAGIEQGGRNAGREEEEEEEVQKRKEGGMWAKIAGRRAKPNDCGARLRLKAGS